MNRSDIVRAVANREGLTITQADHLIEGLLDVIGLALSCEEEVQFKGFGKFQVFDRAPVQRVNPKTGKVMNIPGYKTVGFRPSPILRKRINK